MGGVGKLLGGGMVGVGVGWGGCVGGGGMGMVEWEVWGGAGG